MNYCANPFSYHRRVTREVMIGHVGVGGANPIRVQSMITCDTMDTEASIAQTMELAAAGCEIVRITAPTVKDAANLQHIVRGLHHRGCDAPIVADIHFKPEAAMEAAKWVEKVRINPGNYADSKKFKIIEYSDEQYAAEIERIRQRFTPLVLLSKQRGIAMRIGTNHGSLSDRILNRYGDTPLGMVESALEFARIARDLDYHGFIFSMKSSNPKVMINAYRLLVARLQQEGEDWNYPIHLGVTEAGEGEDARIKSAIGIGSLLDDGIGDTIRVSLTEDSIHEIPVAQTLAAPYNTRLDSGQPRRSNHHAPAVPYDPFSFQRRPSQTIHLPGINGDIAIGAGELVRVFVHQANFNKIAHKIDRMGDYKPELILEDALIIELDPNDDSAIAELNNFRQPQLVTVRDSIELPVVAAFRLLAAKVA
ncbi:MAG: (E)-4-hydroxy-3-methylbut-2-enyl-diphosphate synthase, partial [Chthoniobacterales bacterium]|nr:(E)-4-hydroxy-3-methylbut-2-enyl-diphosphate synthase [Chthoniobacterales bacterium]